MWQRWNSSTKIFEKSSNDGSTWSALGLDAAILTQGLLNLTDTGSNYLAGKLGIGITPVSGAKFQIKAATDKDIIITDALSLTGSIAMSAINDANSANIPFEFRGTNFEFLSTSGNVFIDSSGRFGIGITPAAGIAQIKAATDKDILFSDTVAYTGSVAINAINDGNSVNIPLELRASKFGFTGMSANVEFNAAGTVKMGAYGAGAATFDASGNITSVSDERLKTNIKPFSYGLSAIRLINPIFYNWKISSGLESKLSYPGFLAQNVQNAMYSGVFEGPKGELQNPLVSVVCALVNAVKELDSRIKLLEGN